MTAWRRDRAACRLKMAAFSEVRSFGATVQTSSAVRAAAKADFTRSRLAPVIVFLDIASEAVLTVALYNPSACTKRILAVVATGAWVMPHALSDAATRMKARNFFMIVLFPLWVLLSR